MARSPWREAEFVSSESEYVQELVRGIKTVVGVVREGLEQKKYLRSVCDKLVGLVLARFSAGVVRCRPIAQVGAEQVSGFWVDGGQMCCELTRVGCCVCRFCSTCRRSKAVSSNYPPPRATRSPFRQRQSPEPTADTLTNRADTSPPLPAATRAT